MPKVYTISGLPIVDAKRPITLHITKADIARAADSIQEPARCAAARACYRELGAKEVRIHMYRAYVRTNDHNWVRYYVDGRLRHEIIAFDRGGSFEPGEYKLSKMPPSMQVTGKHQGGNDYSGRARKRKERDARKRKSYHVTANVRGGPATQS
jgi:hypothetical protein